MGLIDDETDHRRLPGGHEPPEAISHSSREHPVSEVCSGDHALAGKIRKVVRINQTRRERLVVDDARTAVARRGAGLPSATGSYRMDRPKPIPRAARADAGRRREDGAPSHPSQTT